MTVARTLALGLAAAVLLAGVSAPAANWYVDNAVSGGTHNGTSWANAWPGFASVVWGSSGVKAGDTLFISGGTTSKVYTEAWSVGASGTAASPIRIALDATNASHNGVVIFDYDAAGDTAAFNGIGCLRSYITFDGNVGGACRLTINNLRNIVSRYACYGIYADGTTGVVIDHVASTNCSNPLRLASATGFRVSNCSLRQVRGDAVINAAGCSGGWDANVVCSNVLEILFNSAVPPGQAGPYFGPDCIQCSSGVSIYGNKISENLTSLYTSTQHPDMVQATGNYIKIYGNDFLNVGDSVFDYDCYDNPNPHDVWIYNNTFRITQDIDEYPEYFRLYCSYNYVGSVTNFKILNNTFLDNTSSYMVIRFNEFNGDPTASGVEIKNNIFYNCGGGSSGAPLICIDPSTNFTASSFAFDANIYYQATATPYISYRGTDYTAANWVSAFEPHGKTTAPKFVSYAPAAPGNDLHLQSGDVAAKDAGLSFSSYFNTDKDGIPRPQGPAWDIGAYELVSGGGTNLPPVVSAVSQNAADVDASLPGLQIYAGTAAQYSGSASDPNGDPLTWQWIYAINGGAENVLQSGSGAAPAVNYIYGAGTAGQTFLWTLRVSDGQFTSQSQLTVGVEAPPVTGSLVFEAESGLVTAPFLVLNGVVSQPVLTDAVSGGRAAYTFVITNAGNYVIQMLVNAPTLASNSLYLNMDAEPQDPGMIWDIIPVTTNFEQRVVSWRGNGTSENDQFVPQIFSLSAGTHQLIIRGREPGVQLDRFSILRVPRPPNNLRVVPAP